MDGSRNVLRAALGSAVLAMLIGGSIVYSGCVVQPDGRSDGSEQTGAAEESLLTGDPAPNQRYEKAVLVGECSGALLTREWAIVAKHCMPSALDPNNPVRVWYGFRSKTELPTSIKQVRDVVEMVHHPSNIDLTLVRVGTAFDIDGSNAINHRRAVFPGASSELNSQYLKCVGFKKTTDGSGGVTYDLAWANKRVGAVSTGTGSGDILEFHASLVPGLDAGPVTGPGDDGAVCYWYDGSGSYHLAGVISGGSGLSGGLYMTTFITSIASGVVGSAPSVRQWLNNVVYHRFAGAVVGVNNNKSLEIDPQAFGAGNPGGARFWTGGGGASQKWWPSIQSNGTTSYSTFELRSKDPVHSWKWYLHSDNISGHQATSTSTSAAQWRWQTDAIVGYGDKCVHFDDYYGWVTLGDCEPDATPTAWSLNASTATTNPYAFVNGGKCLGIQGGQVTEGADVEMSACNGGATQKWLSFSDGTIRPLQGLGYCLHVPGPVYQNNFLEVRSCDGSARQQFHYRGRLSRLYLFPNTPKCLNAKAFGTANGTWAEALNCIPTSSAQQFDYYPSDFYPGK